MGGDDLAPRPYDALGRRCVGDQEGVRDFGGGETADRSQSQRYLRRAGERGMTTGKHQPHPIIRLLKDRLLKLRQLFTVARIAAQLVEGATPGDSQQPGTGPLGDSIDRPALQRYEQGILDDFLRHSEVAQDAHQGGGERPCLLSEDSSEGSIGGATIDHDYWSTPITGRISTVPRPGQDLARRRASSRSATVISAKPPMTSLPS